MHTTTSFLPSLIALPVHGKDITSSNKGCLTKRSFHLLLLRLNAAEGIYNCMFPKELCLNGSDCPYSSWLFLTVDFNLTVTWSLSLRSS